MSGFHRSGRSRLYLANHVVCYRQHREPRILHHVQRLSSRPLSWSGVGEEQCRLCDEAMSVWHGRLIWVFGILLGGFVVFFCSLVILDPESRT